jgi:hypothetical protein
MSTSTTQVNIVNVVDDMVNSTNTKSHKIRWLFGNGFTKGQISQMLDIRYQHVRNVLLQPLKSQPK